MTTHRQQPHLLPVLGLLLLVALAGCESQQHRRDADRYMQLRDYPSAVAHYQQALQLEPKLANDPAFMTSLHDAQRENALTLSNTLLASDQPEQAVNVLEAALPNVTGDPTLLAALTSARHAAAETLHRRALAAADRADLAVAQTNLQQALKYEPQHPASLAALQSITNPAAFPPAVQQTHAAAKQAMADKQWQQAAEHFAALIAQSSDDLPARADAWRVSQQIAQVESHLAAAQRASAVKQLDAAIAELKAALDAWPRHAASLALLNDVVARRTRATELADASADALKQKQYDAAIASAQASLALFPTYADARQIDALARRSAADDLVAAGLAARGQSDYPAANAAFSKALTYLPKMPEAQSGLASVATAQADAALQAARPGLALLYRMKAAEQWPSTDNRRALDLARQTLRAKGAFALLIDSRSPSAQVTADTAPFAAELLTLLRRQAPSTLAVNPTPLPNDRPVFRAAVAVVRSQVTQAMTSQQELTQSFTVPVRVPNDQIPALRDQLRIADAEYDRLKDRTDKANDRLRDYQKSHTSDSPDYQKNIKALQYSVNEGKHDSDEARRILDRAKDQLRDAPRFITAQQIRQWPYLRQHYTQTASVVATVSLTDSADRALVAPFSISHDVIAEDDTTLQPNPDLGVPSDPLSLPAPDDMQQQAVSESAAQAAGKLLDAAVRCRAANLQSQADALRQSGNTDQALELDIAAALVGESIDPQAAADRLAQLRAAVTASP